jgi:transposase
VRRNVFWLSDEQWERIEPHLSTDVRGVERADDRRVSLYEGANGYSYDAVIAGEPRKARVRALR